MLQKILKKKPRFSFGTTQLSKINSAVILALIPHLSSTFDPKEKPSNSLSTMNKETSFAVSPVFAYTKINQQNHLKIK